jgi:hypothetical protein
MLLASSLPPLDAAPLIAVPRPIDDILSPKLRHLLSYWDSKREGRALPARRKLAPEDMVEMLPRVGLIDVIRPPLRFRYRLLGGEIELLAHGLKTGAMLDDIRSPSYRDNDRIHFAAAVDTARPSVHRIRTSRPTDANRTSCSAAVDRRPFAGRHAADRYRPPGRTEQFFRFACGVKFRIAIRSAAQGGCASTRTGTPPLPGRP